MRTEPELQEGRELGGGNEDTLGKRKLLERAQPARVFGAAGAERAVCEQQRAVDQCKPDAFTGPLTGYITSLKRKKKTLGEHSMTIY